MNKSELRKMIVKSLEDLTPEYKENADAKITENILSMPEYENAGTVFCFVGTEDEINTEELIDRMLADNKKVCVPLCTDNGIMVAKHINSRESLSEGKYGIMEPSESSATIAPDDIDFAIIPCVTCNKRGQRLGHGGGYYDRYFENLDIPCALICREETMTLAIPTGGHDLKFKTVVSERGIFRNE